MKDTSTYMRKALFILFSCYVRLFHVKHSEMISDFYVKDFGRKSDDKKESEIEIARKTKSLLFMRIES